MTVLDISRKESGANIEEEKKPTIKIESLNLLFNHDHVASALQNSPRKSKVGFNVATIFVDKENSRKLERSVSLSQIKNEATKNLIISPRNNSSLKDKIDLNENNEINRNHLLVSLITQNEPNKSGEKNKENLIVSTKKSTSSKEKKEKIKNSKAMLEAALLRQWNKVIRIVSLGVDINYVMNRALYKKFLGRSSSGLNGCNVLHLALLDRSCTLSTINILVEKKANINLKNEHGYTPLDIAKIKEEEEKEFMQASPELAEFKEKATAIKTLLLSKSTFFNQKNTEDPKHQSSKPSTILSLSPL